MENQLSEMGVRVFRDVHVSGHPAKEDLREMIKLTNPENIINMLRLTDLRLMKTILFAIGFSSVILFIGLAIGLIDPSHISIKTSYIGVLVGGALLGLGFAVAGYCPGTGLAAMATGRKDAIFFVLGGLLGALVFTLTYGYLAENTTIFAEIAGGAVGFSDTGNTKHPALITSVSGTVVGVLLGLMMMAIAWFLPLSICKNIKK